MKQEMMCCVVILMSGKLCEAALMAVNGSGPVAAMRWPFLLWD